MQWRSNIKRLIALVDLNVEMFLPGASLLVGKVRVGMMIGEMYEQRKVLTSEALRV